MRGGRTPEMLVGNLAYKTPLLHSYSNVGHHRLCLGELMGFPIRMQGVPVVGAGRKVNLPGKTGIVYDNPPEMEALERWRKGDFLGVERSFAKSWRQALALQPKTIKRLVDTEGRRLKISDLNQAIEMAQHIVAGNGRRWATLKATMLELDVSDQEYSFIVKRWKSAGGPSLPEFAPYNAHVMTVDLFFHIAMASGHIAAERASNHVDAAYLYYLPFTEVFVSGDKLHARVVPLFAGPKHQFVWAPDLKADLAALDNHFSAHPDLEEHGLMRIAGYPPIDGHFLTQALYDHSQPEWRVRAGAPLKPTGKVPERLMEEIKAFKNAKPAPVEPNFNPDSVDAVTFERMVPLRRGKWRFLPKGVENS